MLNAGAPGATCLDAGDGNKASAAATAAAVADGLFGWQRALNREAVVA